MTKHYVLIDNYTGFVWGETDAADPIDACERFDKSVGNFGLEYEYGHISGTTTSGYHVYEAPVGWVQVMDGQVKQEIDRVEEFCTKIGEVISRNKTEE